MEETTVLATAEDAAVGLLTEAVERMGGEVLFTAHGDLLMARLKNKNGKEYTFPCMSRAAPSSLERVQELLALGLWRRIHGHEKSGLVIRVPRLPMTRLEHWIKTIDAMLAQGTAKQARQATMPFALCSEHGGGLLRLPGLTANMPDPVFAHAPTKPRSDIPQHDAALRALKLLLAQMGDHTCHWWGGAREPINTGLRLARLAQTSSSGVYVLMESMAKRGWIRKGYAQELRLLNVPAVLSWWLDQAKHRQRSLIPVRPLYAPTRPLTAWPARCRWLREQASTRMNPPRLVGGSNPHPWAVSGWAACHLLDLGILQHSEAKPFTLTISHSPARVPGFLADWHLVECDQHDAVFWIEATGQTHRVALFATLEVDGLPVVDGWQAALDVASDPDRGIEQARAIAERLWPQA